MLSVRSRLGSKSGRVGLLLWLLIGWSMIALGSVVANRAMVAVAAAITGLGNIALVKTLFETSSAVTSSASAMQKQLERDEQLVNSRLDRTREAVDRVRNEVTGAVERLIALSTASDTQRDDLTSLRDAHDTTRAALSQTRSLIDKIAQRARSTARTSQRIVPSAEARPVLSIAIPSYNRPALLAECLASVEAEVTSCGAAVEVRITDDASTDPDTIDVAGSFSERLEYVSLRQHDVNIGLERNLLAACEGCRGDYMLILGNDDRLVPGALRTVLDDLESIAAPVHLYEKQRITQDGSLRNAIAGSSPIELAPGETHHFPTLLEAAKPQGFLSTFGFVSQVAFQRQPFVAIDPGPYLDLTMYPQVFVLIEAFADQPVLYRNQAVVLHRTPTPSQKLAEALGRREEAFMSGGAPKLSQYFGTTLVAAFQRLIDRGAIDYAHIAEYPEGLMTKGLLVDWMIANRQIDPSLDERLDECVALDAERFVAMLNAPLIRAPGV